MTPTRWDRDVEAERARVAWDHLVRARVTTLVLSSRNASARKALVNFGN
ncbi:MAG TPA: hypothetical protein VK550_06775 [Polyangiaceae bacterium]|nr:hypothetical protein [Polyangiaceae bacterium]